LQGAPDYALIPGDHPAAGKQYVDPKMDNDASHALTQKLLYMIAFESQSFSEQAKLNPKPAARVIVSTPRTL